MLSRFCSAVIGGLVLLVPASAQTVRFDTNVGNIDLLLNPNSNPNLQGHVDNILAYVNAGSYDSSFLNRAATGFVLQYGGFTLDPLVAPDSFDDFVNIPTLDPVIVDQNGDGNVDFIGDIDGDGNPDAAAFGLSNTLGTVSLALAAGNPNSGTNSFFVNLGDNQFLDDQGFVPFAEVVDMATVDLIMALPQSNLDPSGQNLAAINVPLVNNVNVVFIERAFVLEDEGAQSSVTFSTVTPMTTAADAVSTVFSTLTAASDTTPVTTFSTLSPVSDNGAGPVTFSTLTPNPDAASSTSSVASMSSSTASAVAPSAGLQAVVVPEPPALVLAIGALALIYLVKPSRMG